MSVASSVIDENAFDDANMNTIKKEKILCAAQGRFSRDRGMRGDKTGQSEWLEEKMKFL